MKADRESETPKARATRIRKRMLRDRRAPPLGSLLAAAASGSAAPKASRAAIASASRSGGASAGRAGGRRLSAGERIVSGQMAAAV